MKNILKILIAFVMLVSCYGLYFASQFSTVYPPLKKYKYQLTALNLQDLIINIDKADTNLTCIITDTVGPKDDLAYHMDISLKSKGVNYAFNIKYEDDKSVWSKSINSEVELIGVFDSTHNVGGYKPENYGVENLIDIFNKEFISKLDKKPKDSKAN